METIDRDREETGRRLQAVVDNVERVIHGKHEAATLAVVGLLAEGHMLLEDVPGTGKTTLARALARSVDVVFRRIQFTSDLLPSDVLGVSIWSAAEQRFAFHPGPIFGNVVLADELNRTTPRTQSALLECMNERRASVEGKTRALPRPFLVLATQNPIEFEGTYPLPESQLDRFLLRLRLGYPDREAERRMLDERIANDPLDDLTPVLTKDELVQAIADVRDVRVEPSLREYVLEFIAATRRAGAFLLGASPRASLGWVHAAQALAAIEGRDFCVPDDFKRLAVPVLAHRVVPAPLAGGTERDADEAIAELTGEVPVPA
jgi:MoxR-like ATPase